MDTCPSWCEQSAAGHSFAAAEDDRVHYGSAAYVRVRSLRASYFSDGAGDGVFERGHICTYLQRRSVHVQPSVNLHISSGDLGIEGCSMLNVALTLDEAEQHANAVLEQVRIARSA